MMRVRLSGRPGHAPQALGALVLAGLLVLATPVHGLEEVERLLEQTRGLEDEREGTEELLDALDEELDSERAELAQLTEARRQAEAELATVEQQLEIAEGQLEAAEERYADAQQRHRAAIAQAKATEVELAERTEMLGEQANAAHRYGGEAKYFKLIDAALSQKSPSDAAAALRRLEHVVEWESDNVTRLGELYDDLLLAEARAEATKEQRDAERETIERARDHVASLHDERESALEQADQRRAEQQDLVASIEGDRAEAERLLTELEGELEAVRDEVAETARARQAQGGGIICPVPTGSFIDDWHFPRSGGRRHKGNDVFADRGQPIYAVANGTVRSVNGVDRWQPGSQRGLGGKTVSIATGPGTHWYFAHLDEIADDVRPGAGVHAGQRIGTVGTTGNARHTPPHLHIGYYPGGQAENPYPLLAAACR